VRSFCDQIVRDADSVSIGTARTSRPALCRGRHLRKRRDRLGPQREFGAPLGHARARIRVRRSTRLRWRPPPRRGLAPAQAGPGREAGCGDGRAGAALQRPRQPPAARASVEYLAQPQARGIRVQEERPRPAEADRPDARSGARPNMRPVRSARGTVETGSRMLDIVNSTDLWLRILHISAWVARRFQPQSPGRTQRVSRPRASRRAHRPPAPGGRAGRGRWAAQPREASRAVLLVRARPSRPSRHGRRPRRRCPRSPDCSGGVILVTLCGLCELRGSFRYSIRPGDVINPEELWD
jgi:hypothetical protein